MASTPKAMYDKVANLDRLRRMTRQQLKANTCSRCQATYSNRTDRNECEALHRRR